MYDFACKKLTTYIWRVYTQITLYRVQLGTNIFKV